MKHGFHITALLALTLASIPAQAIEFSLLGGLSYAAPTQRASGSDYHWTGDDAFSWGLTVAIPIFLTPFDFETGVFVIKEQSERDASGVTVTQKSKMTEIPFLVRFNFDEHIGIGAGAYLGMIDDASQKNDVGILANVRARFDLAPPFYFLLDARYQHGLANRAALPTDLYNTRSIQVFAGFQFILL